MISDERFRELQEIADEHSHGGTLCQCSFCLLMRDVVVLRAVLAKSERHSEECVRLGLELEAVQGELAARAPSAWRRAVSERPIRPNLKGIRDWLTCEPGYLMPNESNLEKMLLATIDHSLAIEAALVESKQARGLAECARRGVTARAERAEDERDRYLDGLTQAIEKVVAGEQESARVRELWQTAEQALANVKDKMRAAEQSRASLATRLMEARTCLRQMTAERDAALAEGARLRSALESGQLFVVRDQAERVNGERRPFVQCTWCWANADDRQQLCHKPDCSFAALARTSGGEETNA